MASSISRFMSETVFNLNNSLVYYNDKKENELRSFKGSKIYFSNIYLHF